MLLNLSGFLDTRLVDCNCGTVLRDLAVGEAIIRLTIRTVVTQTPWMRRSPPSFDVVSFDSPGLPPEDAQGNLWVLRVRETATVMAAILPRGGVRADSVWTMVMSLG